MDENIQTTLEERKKKILNFVNKNKNWFVYAVLSLIVLVSVYLRSLNVSRLKDITTGTWTLGPDLDPFLFLRWAQYIAENGSLMAIDTMRNVPLGSGTAMEMKLLSYMIVWLYDFLHLFSSEVTVTYAAVIFPVIMAALTAVAFFLFARKIFYKESKLIKNSIALVSTALFVLIPSMLPRTIAGIPEKESAAFFFLFMALYLFLEAFTSEKFKNKILFAVFAGISTGMMALIWGGVIFIFFAIPASILLAFILKKIQKNEIILYAVWLIVSFAVMMPFSTRYALKNLVMSTSTGFAIGVLILVAMSFGIMKIKKLEGIRRKIKIPKEVFALIISLVVLFLAILVLFGPSFVLEQIQEVKNSLITPVQGRWNTTVAENKQPYFTDEWADEFGPILFNVPIYFWMFFIGAVALFKNLINPLKKNEKFILVFSYAVFLACVIFSRYSSASVLNGTGGMSLFVYFGGWIFFLGTFAYAYYKRYQTRSLDVFREFNFSYILYFLIFTLALIGARGGIRLIMVLGAVSPIAAAFLVVKVSEKYSKEKDDLKFFTGLVAVLIIAAAVFTSVSYYKEDVAMANAYAPSFYQWQWQSAMEWVRENTSEDAVFGHWWDYGYWLQSIGERATVVDGGNVITFWNYWMGRLVLTGDNQTDALDFLYAHDTDYLLIDSTDIGKYGAFSSIGSDENYDRYSWIPTMLMSESQTAETSNATIYFYTGSYALDEDLVIEDDGKEVLLPAYKTGVGAIMVPFVSGSSKLIQPEVIMVYNNKQYQIKMKYAFIDGEFYEFDSGINATAFLFPSVSSTSVNSIGAAMFISPRVMRGLLAQIYLLNDPFDNFPNFEIAHVEESLVVQGLESQGISLPEFVYYQGLQGPIKIWKINYTGNEEIQEKYLDTDSSKYLSWKL